MFLLQTLGSVLDVVVVGVSKANPSHDTSLNNRKRQKNKQWQINLSCDIVLTLFEYNDWILVLNWVVSLDVVVSI